MRFIELRSPLVFSIDKNRNTAHLQRRCPRLSKRGNQEDFSNSLTLKFFCDGQSSQGVTRYARRQSFSDLDGQGLFRHHSSNCQGEET